MTKLTPNLYAEAKASIKTALENEGKKYPTNTNALSEEFIIKRFAPCLEKEDLLWLIAKRSECKKATKKDGVEEVPVGNWFPAFRSAVGEKFFPEFGEKKPKSKVDENADFLEDLLAKMAG